MNRPPASQIAADLREARQDKVLTLEVNGKKISPERKARMERHINSLHWAAIGFDNLAAREAEKDDERRNAGAA